MAPRPREDIALPAWLTVERAYDGDHEATVAGLVAILSRPIPDALPADVTPRSAQHPSEEALRADR